MKIPKIISKNGHEYIFVKKFNDKVYVYKDMIYGYKEAFDLYDLGLIEPVMVRPKSLRKPIEGYHKKNKW